jgi:hypothetical protein
MGLLCAVAYRCSGFCVTMKIFMLQLRGGDQESKLISKQSQIIWLSTGRACETVLQHYRGLHHMKTTARVVCGG